MEDGWRASITREIPNHTLHPNAPIDRPRPVLQLMRTTCLALLYVNVWLRDNAEHTGKRLQRASLNAAISGIRLKWEGSISHLAHTRYNRLKINQKA